MKTHMKKINAIVLSISMVAANPAWSARGEGTPTTTTLPQQQTPQTPEPSYTPPPADVTLNAVPTVQTAAKEGKGKTNTGMILGIGAAAFCTYKAIATCNNPATAGLCKLYIAGVVASVFVISSMSKAKDKSSKTCDGVSVAGCEGNSTGGVTGGSTGGSAGSTGGNRYVGGPSDPRNSDEYKQLQANIKDLEKQGYKIDQATGKVTLPNGKSLSPPDLNNPNTLAANGIDPKGFADMMKQAEKAGQDLAAKGVDNNSSMFGDALGGGGGGGSYSGGGDGDGGGSGLAQKGLGIDRDPAQVSGMAVNYNGESIGVGPDNLFKMIHRRYDLHKSKGNFIGGNQ